MLDQVLGQGVFIPIQFLLKLGRKLRLIGLIRENLNVFNISDVSDGDSGDLGEMVYSRNSISKF